MTEAVVGILIGSALLLIVGPFTARSYKKLEAESDAALDRLDAKISAIKAERDALLVERDTLLAERDRLVGQVEGIRGLVKVWEIEGDYKEHES